MSKTKLSADTIRHLKYEHDLTEVEIAKLSGTTEKRIYDTIYPPRTNVPKSRTYYLSNNGEYHSQSAFFVTPEIAYALATGEWPE